MIGRLLGKASSKLLSAEIMGLILLLTALQSFTYGISSSLRSADEYQSLYFFWVCSIATLMALGLSKLKLNGIRASVGIVAVGVMGIWILGARLASPLLDLGKAIFIVLPQIIPAIRSHISIDTTAIANAWFVAAAASGALGARIQIWLMSLNKDVTVNDALVLNLVWTLILWLIAAWMGWFAGRRNAVAALTPPIVLLAAVTSYSGYRIYTLWLMVTVLLLLMGLWNYKEHTMQWLIKKVDYSDSIRYDVGQAVIFFTIVIGVITFITPSVSWREIRDFLREQNRPSRSEAADVLGIQQQRVPVQKVPSQKPSLPRDHLLTAGFAQSEKVVMTIRTGELLPMGSPYATVEAPHHYWRSTTYDTYVGAGWITSAAVPQKYPANTPLIPGLLTGYKALHMDVNIVEPEGKLFWSGILFSADVPIRVDWRLRPQSSLFADQATLLQADMFLAANSAPAYKADSYIPRLTVEELQAASTNYPDGILKRYLQLPSSLPERVYLLSRQITAGKTNTYDKAKAIEAYLRTYPYDLEVPAPPEGKDVADYFLFELKKGYCDYYATAMVVLARASGIPARFVSGYSSGSYDAASAEYIVRELNAHSWAEVYFPEIGWVEFEPTAAQPEVEFALSNNDLTPEQQTESAAARLLYRFRLKKTIYWLSPIAVLLLAFILYFTLVERWRYLHLAPAVAIEKVYRRLYRLGRPLAGERTQAETAYEFMQKLVAGINKLPVKERSRSRKLLSSVQQDVKSLTDIYQSALFSHGNIQKNEARKALKTWKHLRPRLLMARAHALLRKRIKTPSS